MSLHFLVPFKKSQNYAHIHVDYISTNQNSEISDVFDYYSFVIESVPNLHTHCDQL